MDMSENYSCYQYWPEDLDSLTVSRQNIEDMSSFGTLYTYI